MGNTQDSLIQTRRVPPFGRYALTVRRYIYMFSFVTAITASTVVSVAGAVVAVGTAVAAVANAAATVNNSVKSVKESKRR